MRGLQVATFLIKLSRRRRVIVLLAVSIPLPGCTGVQSALEAHGPQAQALASLFWIFTAVLTAVWLVVMAGLLIALVRPPLRERLPAATRRMTIAFTTATAAGVTVILALAILSFSGQAAVFDRNEKAAVTIDVIGHQWWWQVRYERPSPGFETANEIRIPVGVPVDIRLSTADVIHSFWIPSLAGKLDLIPGRENELRIEADKPGVYRGQCAEFCGRQHAHMAIYVVALDPAAFDEWRAAQLKPAGAQATAAANAGGTGPAGLPVRK
jgi:cytochrome c oxidase subunit 2